MCVARLMGTIRHGVTTQNTVVLFTMTVQTSTYNFTFSALSWKGQKLLFNCCQSCSPSVSVCHQGKKAEERRHGCCGYSVLQIHRVLVCQWVHSVFCMVSLVHYYYSFGRLALQQGVRNITWHILCFEKAWLDVTSCWTGKRLQILQYGNLEHLRYCFLIHTGLVLISF